MPFYYKRFFASGALCLFFVAPPALAEDVTAALPSEIRTLLQQEMLEIDAVMKEIHGAIVRGGHEVVAAKGQAIHDSFILKKIHDP